ncbi:MAG: DNA translocase FtsK 4TM domain-containing protein [Myxococcota bacterium]
MSILETASEEEFPHVRSRRHEVFGIICGASTALVALSLYSYDARGGENLVGPVGTAIAASLVNAFGIAAWVIPVELFLSTFRLFGRRSATLGVATVAATLVIVLVACALLHLSIDGVVAFGGHAPGGVLGEVLGEVARSLLGLIGAYVVGASILLITAVLRTPLSIVGTVGRCLSWFRDGLLGLWAAGLSFATAWREARRLELEEREAALEAVAPKIVGFEEAPVRKLARKKRNPGSKTSSNHLSQEASSPLLSEDRVEGDHISQANEEGCLSNEVHFSNRISGGAPVVQPAVVDRLQGALLEAEEEVESLEHTAAHLEERPKPQSFVASAESSSFESLAEAERAVEEIGFQDSEFQPPALPEPPALEQDLASSEDLSDVRGPKIVAPGPQAPVATTPLGFESEPRAASASPVSPFRLPPSDLLAAPPENIIPIEPEVLRANAKRLVEKLEAYGVKGRVDEIHPGPVVTMYEFEPQSGTKLSKIANLSDDLAMALAAQKVRIVAPIPGKARVGFELPNEHRQIVYLRDILEDAHWEKQKGSLPFALGKDISGNPVYGDLAKMPHLLVAGATGQGKSVGINVMLVSLLAKKTPEEVRLLMIDPKVVELAVFDGIPHMLLPVVTDMKKAALALKWAVDEMERRYQLFADAGTRNILTYNARVQKVLDGQLTPENFCRSRRGAAEDNAPKAPERLPHIVVVVDEFADLMMVAAKDVEACVARLAQKARAAGIHVLLATQRPSVDVITGMIKANFPARMAFKVSQREDSKTILGRNGAEHLLGRGDLLLLPPGSSDLTRVHGAFIDEEEVKSVCDHLRAQASPVYDEDILKPREDEEDGPLTGRTSDDPLYDKAVAVVADVGYCSISHIQRQLSVGYNKAAKLVERMETEGIVGPASGKAGGRREVFVQSH